MNKRVIDKIVIDKIFFSIHHFQFLLFISTLSNIVYAWIYWASLIERIEFFYLKLRHYEVEYWEQTQPMAERRNLWWQAVGVRESPKLKTPRNRLYLGFFFLGPMNSSGPRGSNPSSDLSRRIVWQGFRGSQKQRASVGVWTLEIHRAVLPLMLCFEAVSQILLAEQTRLPIWEKFEAFLVPGTHQNTFQ